MPSRLLRLQERTALDTFPPELSEEEVGAHDTVGPADLALVRTRRRPDNRLGLALQRCALRHLGFFPADLTGAPTLVLSWLASQVGADPADLAGYRARYKTLCGHRDEVMAHAGYRPVAPGDLKRLGDWLTTSWPGGWPRSPPVPGQRWMPGWWSKPTWDGPGWPGWARRPAPPAPGRSWPSWTSWRSWAPSARTAGT